MGYSPLFVIEFAKICNSSSLITSIISSQDCAVSASNFYGAWIALAGDNYSTYTC
jgi:hypothetical protein